MTDNVIDLATSEEPVVKPESGSPTSITGSVPHAQHSAENVENQRLVSLCMIARELVSHENRLEDSRPLRPLDAAEAHAGYRVNEAIPEMTTRLVYVPLGQENMWWMMLGFVFGVVILISLVVSFGFLMPLAQSGEKCGL